MHDVTRRLAEHYRDTFAKHGATPRGVDWRADADLILRYDKMLQVVAGDAPAAPSMLDVGCGYGGLLRHARSIGRPLDYTGIDAVPELIDAARGREPTGRFLVGDVLDHPFAGQFDFVVCNGILTQKLTTSTTEMDRFAEGLLERMFSLARRGIVFNVMSTAVEYRKDNLYHRDPGEVVSWCISKLSRHVRLDHAYPLFEYCIYVYRQGLV